MELLFEGTRRSSQRPVAVARYRFVPFTIVSTDLWSIRTRDDHRSSPFAADYPKDKIAKGDRQLSWCESARATGCASLTSPHAFPLRDYGVCNLSRRGKEQKPTNAKNDGKHLNAIRLTVAASVSADGGSHSDLMLTMLLQAARQDLSNR